ncbi:calcium-binding protein [Oculatella sp. LEGE 06141]|uniref:beta strand repeat-containing protein n=1 Tax=Oculatella sp. LEGE 06141 TaxID=1828648 RepID=UPI001D155737|nr:calcium-binding protein [Oculatella sp. LEGE 06141]
MGSTGNLSNSGYISITPVSTSTATATANGIVAGLAGVGATDATANITGSTKAFMDGKVTDASNLTLTADGKNTANANSNASALALGGVSGATARANLNPTVTAQIGGSGQVQARGNVSVVANAVNAASSNADGKALTLGAGVGTTKGSTFVNSNTTAQMNGSVLNANNVTVFANSTDHGRATTESAAGGLLAAGTGTEATSSVTPKTHAQIGDNARVNATTDIIVRSQANVDSDAKAEGYGGAAGVKVGFSSANASMNPTISAAIGNNTNIAAGGNLTVEALQGLNTGGALPGSNIGDGSFNAQNANSTTETITTTQNHGLSSEDTVTYFNGGNTSINGLEHDRKYKVIKLSDTEVQLGNTFTSNSVDSDTDIITFATDHQFKDGDRLKYEGTGINGLVDGQSYYVRRISDNQIKLVTTLAAATTSAAAFTAAAFTESPTGEYKIQLNNHGFTSGQAVTYRTPSVSNFLASNVVDQYPPVPASEEQPTARQIRAYEHRIDLGTGTHGFVTGQKVRFTAQSGDIGGLTNNQDYYVIRVNDNVLRLASSRAGAERWTTLESEIAVIASEIETLEAKSSLTQVERDRLNTLNANLAPLLTERSAILIELDNGIPVDSFNQGSQGSFSLQAETLPGLQDGQTYYAIAVDANHFQLAATKADALAGTEVAIDIIDATGKYSVAGRYTIGTEGLDLTAPSGSTSSTHKLIFDINTAGTTGTHKLAGAGGALSFRSAPSGDGVVTASASAASGALLGTSETNKATSRSEATVTTNIGSGALITAERNITVYSGSASNAAAVVKSATGSLFVSGNGSDVNSILGNNVRTQIGNDTTMSARGSMTLSSRSFQDVSLSAKVQAYSTFTNVTANSNATINHDVLTQVGQRSRISAKDDLMITSGASIDADVIADASGVGGLNANMKSNANLYITSANTRTTIDRDATIAGGKLTVSAHVHELDAYTHADTSGGGATGDPDATARMQITGLDTKVTLETGATLIGNETITLLARQADLRTKAESDTTFYGIYGTPDARSETNISTSAEVYTAFGSKINTRNLYVEADAVTKGDSASSLESDAAKHGTSAATIALDIVNTAIKIFNAIPFVPDIPLIPEPGSEKEIHNVTLRRSINFNSDMTFFSAPNPELEINADGSIRRQVNVGVQQTATDIIVNDIAPAGAGSATFVIHQRSYANSAGQITGSPPASTVQEAYDYVELVNRSNKNLIINNINVIGVGMPSVTVSVENKGGFTWSNPANSGSVLNPSTIDIQNYGSSNVILQGRIYNPHHVTKIFNAGGDILSRGNGLIETRDLQLTAGQGKIGTETARIKANLIQGFRGVSNSYTVATSAVNSFADTIHLRNHGFTDGQKISYSSSGAPIQGLRSGETYYVIVIGIDDIKLAITEADALARTPVAIDLNTAGATGTHQLQEGIFLDSFAKGAVHLDLQAIRQNASSITVNVDEMTGQTGNVDLSIRQSVDSNNQQQQATYKFGGLTVAGNVKGQVITGGDFIVNAGTSDTRLVGYMDILNNSKVLGHEATIAYTQGGQLDIQTGSDVIFTELTGGLDLRRVTTVKGDINLTLIETADAEAEFFLMHSGATIRTDQGSVTLLVGDDFTMTEGTSISAGQDVTIRTDYNVSNPGIDLDTSSKTIRLPIIGDTVFDGVIVDLRGEIRAKSALVTTNNQRDMINITNVAADKMTVLTYDGDELIHVGSNAIPSLNTGGTLNRVNGLLTIDAGNGADQLILDDSADLQNNVGILTRDRLIGLGMGNTDQTAVEASLGIAYLGFESLQLTLGAGSDTLTVKSTITGKTNLSTADGDDTVNVETISGETIVRTGADNDTVNVGDPNRLVDNIAALLTVKGGSGSDTLNVYDSGDTNDNFGILTDTQITGLDMGGYIDYGTFETLNIRLGSGHDRFEIESTHRGITDLNAGDGNDVVDIHAISGATTVRTAAGNDVVNVGNFNNTVNDINAFLTIKGGIGFDILNVDDSGDTANNVGILTDTQINGLGMRGKIDYGTFEVLDINLGSGSDVFTIESTHETVTNLTTADGDDTVNIEAVYGITTVKAGTGNDTINISNPARLIDNIASQLYIKGGTGFDTLNVDDSGDTTDNTGILTDTQLTGLGMTGQIDYGSFEALSIYTGSGQDVFTVKGTHKGTTQVDTMAGNDTVNVESISGATTISTGEGNDTVNISNSERLVDNISKQLTVKGGTGFDVLNIDDSGDSNDNTGILTESQLSGLGMAGQINYGTFELLDIQTGSGNDRFTIESTHRGSTQLNTAEGNDTVNIESITGVTTISTGADNDIVNAGSLNQVLSGIEAQLTLKGGTGTDYLRVDNSGNLLDTVGSLSETQLTGLSMAGQINYGAFESLAIQLGSGHDVFTIKDTHKGETKIETADGDDTVNIEAISGTTTVSTESGNDVIKISSVTQQVKAIAGLLTLKGGLGQNMLTVDNSGDSTDQSGYLTDTQITGLGMTGKIDYGNLATLEVQLGAGQDVFTVKNTHKGTTNLNTGAGNDTVNVEAIAGATTIAAGEGDDAVNVGNSDRLINGIEALLSIKGGTGNDHLTVDNSGDLADTTGILSESWLIGSGLTGQIDYGSFEALTLLTGAGSDVFTIQSTYKGQTTVNTGEGNDTVNVEAIAGATSIDLNAGDDTVNVGSLQQHLNGIAAQLTVKGSSGEDTLNIVDTGSTTDSSGILTDTQINGLGMKGQINYSAFESLDMQLGSGSDALIIENTHQGQISLNTAAGNDTISVYAISGETTIKTGAGNDLIKVGNQNHQIKEINAPLLVKGGLGNDSLVLNNAGDASTNSGILTDTQLTGLGMAGHIDYGSFESLEVQLGDGNNTLTVESTHKGQTIVETNKGDDSVVVETGATPIYIQADNQLVGTNWFVNLFNLLVKKF